MNVTFRSASEELDAKFVAESTAAGFTNLKAVKDDHVILVDGSKWTSTGGPLLLNGIIEDVCPKCGRTEDAHNQPFERIRRITGYLVGTLDRFNDAKRAEEHDRVKHDVPAAE